MIIKHIPEVVSVSKLLGEVVIMAEPEEVGEADGG